MPGTRARVAILVLTVLLVGCGGKGGDAHASSPGTSAPRRVEPSVAWTGLRNPIVASNDDGAKDPALVAFDGGWVMLFSRVGRAGTWRIGMTRSRDLRTWSAFETMPHDVATGG